MFSYNQMDVYVQGVSSLAVMATMTHRRKIIITDRPQHPNYISYVLDVNHIYHFGDLGYVEHMMPLRQRAAPTSLPKAVAAQRGDE